MQMARETFPSIRLLMTWQRGMSAPPHAKGREMKWMLGLLVAVVLLVKGSLATAQELTLDAGDSGLSELVTSLVKANLPDNYEKQKHWGEQTRIFDGLHLSMDGLRVDTKRKWKMVNHGTWTMYRVTVTDPNQLTVVVRNIRQLEDGRAGFDAEFAAPLALFGRLSEWQRGVQLVSLSADADARVRLTVSCALKLKLDVGKQLVPDVLLEPEVTAAKIDLVEFRLKRLSQLHGPLAKHLGTEAREIIEDELADRNSDIVAKINKQIAKKQDKLRLSLSDLASTKFGDLTSLVKEK